MKTYFKVILASSCFFSLNFLCKSLTDDFSTDFLIPPAKEDSKWNFKQETPEDLLSQKYRYFSKGKQSYVFLSEDGKHVLKLFKPLAPFWEIGSEKKKFHIGFGKLPFIKSLWIDFSSQEFQNTQVLEFQSYQNALFLFPEKTLLEYMHLTQTSHLQKKLTIYDKIGILHKIDLDSTSFLIQKKTDLLYPTLSNLIKNKEMEKAKILLTNFVNFYFDLIENNIVRPTTLEKNIGCLDLMPIQIDVGRILKAEDLGLSEKVPLNQIYHSTSHMKKWLKVKAPELCTYLENVIETTLERKKP